MTTIQPTTSITIDNDIFEVEKMSAEVQQMIQYLDDWRQDEVDQASQLLKTRSALRDMQNTLLQQIQNEKNSEAESNATDVDSALTE